MRYLLFSLLVGGLLYGGLLFMREKNTFEVNPADRNSAATSTTALPGQGAPEATSTPESAQVVTGRVKDIEPQKKLANPPEIIKALYATSWSAGTESRISALIKLIKETELNAIIIDIKDFSGHVLYDIQNPDVIKYGAKEVRIPRLNTLLKRLHDEGIYAIARITVFQDPVLAQARPELAIHDKRTGGNWYDHKKLAWIDPAAKEAWDYNIAIAKDAAARGFDELNFDYIRFASDGDLSAMQFPVFQATSTLKRTVIKNFFAYLREQLPNDTLSADLFGLTTVNPDDMGIGQVIEDAYQYFDVVAPMTYPSHYASGFLGYKNPGAYPYEVMKYSMENAIRRLLAQGKVKPVRAKLRPWVQDFDLGADYDAVKVRAQIQAVYDAYECPPVITIATSTTTCSTEERMKKNAGWMAWSPSNIYTSGALLPEQ
ncbi:MAG: putative glycoside hydrolase [bacterium]|nr:putative glycoside hydrolase [bacterium]